MCEQVLLRLVDDPVDVIPGLVEFFIYLVCREGRLNVTSSEEWPVLRDDFRAAGRNLKRDLCRIFRLVWTYDENVMRMNMRE